MRDDEALLSLEERAMTRRKAWHETFVWRVTHASGFAIGGLTFIAGTLILFLPATDANNLASAVLYIVGSLGFLYVDLLEFATYTDCPLRGNILMSAAGSLLYVLGSAGFLPSVTGATSVPVGIAGFIAGSAAIGVSQIWKSCRIATDDDDGRPRLATLLGSADAATAAAVESSAGAGAWLFFVGTVMLAFGPSAGPWYTAVLVVWLLGSGFFSAGAAVLTWRHFVMGVS